MLSQVEAQIPKTHCWKLLDATYGLIDAAYEWYQTLMNRLYYMQQIYECNTQLCLFYSKTDNEQCMGLLIVHVDDILFERKTELENRVQRTLKGLNLDLITRQNFDFLALSVATYSDHIETKPVLRDVISIQDFGNMPAAEKEMAIRDRMVAMTRSLIGKLQWMTTFIRPDFSKKS